MRHSVNTHTNFVTLLKHLVEMPTVTADKAANHDALKWIKRQLKGLPLHFTDFEHQDFGALIVTTRPTKHPKVLLNAHVDVVPAPPEQFVFKEENGRYYGRGVFDMKFAVATFINLLQKLGDRLPEYDLGVVFTTDEEDHGGALGISPLMEAGWRADIVIDPDAITPAWTIQRAAKGIVRYHLTCTGETGHGSRPWMYRNAIDSVINFLTELRAYFPTEPCSDDKHAHSTLSIGIVQGGAAINQVADHAEAKFEIRLAPGETSVAETQALIKRLAVKYSGMKFEVLFKDEPLILDTNLEYVQRMQSLITEVAGQTNTPHLAHGGSEASHYAAKGIPVILFQGPGGNSHGADEWIDAKGLEQFSRIIERFVDQEARSA